MDSSPRPQRRFSRWKTTKRTFVLAGVAYKPPDANTVPQDDSKKPDSVKKNEKVNHNKNDKNKTILNHSTTDSVTKQRHRNPPLVAKSSVARRLYLDTSRRKDSKNNVTNSAKTPSPAQEAANDTNLKNGITRKEGNVPQSTSVAMTEKCGNHVEVGPPLLQDFHLLLQRVNLRSSDADAALEAAQQNKKCALSNNSQNKSASKLSHNASEKSSAVHHLPSQDRVNAARDRATEGVPEVSGTMNEANKRKRLAADDEKSSDSSSTDKENVEKDSANISVPSQSKKLKKDGVLPNMPSVTKNVTFENLDISQKTNNDNKTSEDLSARRSSLRNRSLLASPKTLMKARQYPVFNVTERKTAPEENVSKVNNVSNLDQQSSSNRKTAKRTLLPELEILKGKKKSRITGDKSLLSEADLSKVKDTAIKNSSAPVNRKTTGRLGSSELEVSKSKDTSRVNIGTGLSKKDQSKKTSTKESVPKKRSTHQKNQNKDKRVHSSRNDVTTPTDSNSLCSVHSEGTNSLSVKNGHRNHSMLPMPEEVQQQRQSLIKSFLASRRSVGKSDSDSHHEDLAQRQQKSVHDKDSFLQSEQTGLSSGSARKIIQEKNKTQGAVSERRPVRRKCSSPFQHISINSCETSERRKTVLEHAKTAKSAGAANTRLNAKSRIHVRQVERTKDSSSEHVIGGYSEDADSFSVKSSLRDRHLLPTSKEVQKQRRYPIKFFEAGRGSSDGDTSDSGSKYNVSVKKEQKRVQTRELSQSEQTEQNSTARKIMKAKLLTVNKNGIHAHLKRRLDSKKSSSPLQNSSLISDETTQFAKQRETEKVLEHTCNVSQEESFAAENTELSAEIRIGRKHVEKKTDSLSGHSVHSEHTDSFSVKRSLRDRSMLPTPEEVQRHRQYPIEFLTSKRSSLEKSGPDSTRIASGKKSQKRVVQDTEPSQLEQTEHLSMSPNIIKKKLGKRNNNRTCAISKSQPEVMKFSSQLQHDSLSSPETELQSSQRESTYNMLIEKPASVGNIGISAKAKSDVNYVEKINPTPSALKKTKKDHGHRIGDHATAVQPTLNLSKTRSTANSAYLLEQKQSAHKTQKLSEKDSSKGRACDNRTSKLSNKLLSKKDKKQNSLPRQAAKTSKGSHFVTSVGKSGTSFATPDECLEPLQQSATAVDTSRRRPQKAAIKNHPSRQKTNSNVNEGQSVFQKHAEVTRANLSTNETEIVHKKLPRKRKLLEEQDEEEGSSTRRIKKNEGRSKGGRSRKAARVSAFDVILEAVTDTEDRLLAETEDDAFGQRLVRRAMGTLKKKIQPLITGVEEIKNLQHEIRQKNSNIRKLSAEISEQQQLRAQLSKEMRNGIGIDQDLDLISVSETMKAYAQLMQAFANRPR
ncbi:hypothetical protein BsWGS_05877 [Bradybaena similaris]